MWKWMRVLEQKWLLEQMQVLEWNAEMQVLER